MQLTDIGTVIAERELAWTDRNGQNHRLKVEVGLPQPFNDSSGYFAPYQITGIGEDRIRYAAGIDAIQALQGVMVLIGADLFAINKECGQCLSWLDASGDLGFPIP